MIGGETGQIKNLSAFNVTLQDTSRFGVNTLNSDKTFDPIHDLLYQDKKSEQEENDFKPR